MKRYIAVFVPLALIMASCSSKDIPAHNVPSIVLNALKTKYPFTNDVDWEKHGDLYEAELELNDSIDVSVRIDEAGKVIMQKQDVHHSELTSAITAVIRNQYTDYIIDDVERIEKNSIIYYQVELDGKAKKEMKLVFSVDGGEEKSFSYWD